jgi:hypothetical protein
MPSYKFVLPLFAALIAAACDSNPEPDPKPASEQLSVCHFDSFEVEVTQGPSAGLKLAGELAAVENEVTGRLYGALETDSGSIPWTGQYSPGGRISVAFQVDAQTVISGVGPIAGSLCADGAPIEGIAFGPTVAASYGVEGTDVGHWILSTPTASALMLDFNDPVQASLGESIGLSPDILGGQTYDLTSGGGIVTQSECKNCGGTVKGGACVGPGTVAEGSQAFAMCITPLIRNGGIVAALIQYFDL